MAERRGGYQVPTNLHPTESRCVTFELPADLFYIANFWGAVGELAKWTSYERTGDDSGLQAANVMALVIDNARESFLSQQCDLPPEIIEEIIRQTVYVDGGDYEDNEGGFDMGRCSNAVHYDAVKKTLYYLDENCNRVDVPIFPAGNLDYEDWLDSGQPVQEGTEVPNDNPFYKTMDSLKCAKATTIVNEIWNVLALYEAVDGAITFSQIMANILAIYATLSPEPVSKAAAAGVAATMFASVAELGLEEYRNALIEAYEDTGSKVALICQLVPKMKAPTLVWDTLMFDRMTSDDVKEAINAFSTMFAANTSAVKTVKAFSVEGWIEVTQFKVASSPCGCSDYIPAGAADNTPPAPGCLKVYSSENVASIYHPDVDNMTPETLRISTVTVRGVKQSELQFALGALTNNGAGSDVYGAGFLIEMAEGTRLIAGTNMSCSGTCPSDTNWHFGWYGSNAVDGFFEEITTDTQASGATYDNTFAPPVLTDYKYHYVRVRVQIDEGDPAPHAQLGMYLAINAEGVAPTIWNAVPNTEYCP